MVGCSLAVGPTNLPGCRLLASDFIVDFVIYVGNKIRLGIDPRLDSRLDSKINMDSRFESEPIYIDSRFDSNWINLIRFENYPILSDSSGALLS